MKLKVKLPSANDAVLFADKCNKYECDIDLCYQHHVVDAKSTLGVLELINYDCTADIRTEDTDTIDEFKEDINLWIVEE